MGDIDISRLIETAISGFLTGGMGLAVLNWLRVRKSRQRGMSNDESVAVLQSSATRDPLTEYLKRELIRLREDFRRYRVESEKLRRLDAEHIDMLEAHIWQGLGPPPPQPKKKDE